MYLVLLFATTALLGTGRSANVNKYMKLLSELDNNIEPNELPSKEPAARRMLMVLQRPLPAYTHIAGTVLELTCEVTGVPAPSIHWFKNDAPVYEYDMESNELIDSNPNSMSRVVSTLLVTRSAPAQARRDSYTCRATSANNTASASTVVYSKDSSAAPSEREKLLPLKPRIVVTYKSFMDLIGNNIVLPCRVKGHPKPRVTWKDNRGLTVKKHPRMKVLRSGELVISPLRWSDMGGFTCTATNAFGTSQATTFLYPAKPAAKA